MTPRDILPFSSTVVRAIVFEPAANRSVKSTIRQL